MLPSILLKRGCNRDMITINEFKSEIEQAIMNTRRDTEQEYKQFPTKVLKAWKPQIEYQQLMDRKSLIAIHTFRSDMIFIKKIEECIIRDLRRECRCGM